MEMMNTLGDGKFRISIEGNIACGKSTLARYLETRPNVEVHLEPVTKWQDVDGENLLMRYFSNRKRYSYLFQQYALLTMLELHKQPQHKSLFVMERSAYSSLHVFMKVLHEFENVESLEMKCFQKLFDFLVVEKEFKLDLIVYLKSTPEVCFQRMKRRNREGELQGDVIGYLKVLDKYYEDWLGNHDNWSWHGNVPVLILNGDDDLNSDAALHNSMATQIFQQLENRTQSPPNLSKQAPFDVTLPAKLT